jgi:hypothetical protein
MLAFAVMRFNLLLAAFAKRLAARRVHPKTIVVAIMRKLLHLVYGVLKSGQPFEPLRGVTS